MISTENLYISHSRLVREKEPPIKKVDFTETHSSDSWGIKVPKGLRRQL